MDEVENLKKQVSVLEQKLAAYEQNGSIKLFYSLNRKLNEMADILNHYKLNALNLDDPKDKTFERLKVLWADSATLSSAVKLLGESSGATGDEKKDTENRKISFLDKAIT